MFLFMAFNEPRILNQSTIKENKQGHLEDSEDDFKKSLSARSYQTHSNPLFLKVFTSILSPTMFVYTQKHTHTQNSVFYTHKFNLQLFRDGNFWNLIKPLWHCVPRTD